MSMELWYVQMPSKCCFCLTFLHFWIKILEKHHNKTQKIEILTCFWSVQHPNASQNIQQIMAALGGHKKLKLQEILFSFFCKCSLSVSSILYQSWTNKPLVDWIVNIENLYRILSCSVLVNGKRRVAFIKWSNPLMGWYRCFLSLSRLPKRR